MPTYALQVGVPTTLVQNLAYALPACRCILFAEETETFTQSADAAFTASTAITLTNGQAELAGGFLKCTSGTPIVVVKKL